MVGKSRTGKEFFRLFSNGMISGKEDFLKGVSRAFAEIFRQLSKFTLTYTY